jgi:hypothetical protein
MRLAIVIVLATLVASPALADEAEDKAAAQALVTEGIAALKKKDYDTAVAKFQSAYAKFPSPKILLNLGTTYKDMGRLADAANTYQKYLGDPTVGTDRLAEVRKILDDLDKQLVLLTISVTPAGASVTIDDGPAEVIGASLVIRVAPGKHTIRARAFGHDDGLEEFDAAAGTRRTVALSLSRVKEVKEVVDPIKTPPDDVAIGGGEDPDGPVFDPPVDDDGGGKARLPGLAVQARIDGKLRGAAMAIGVDYAPIEMLEVELAALLSNAYGVYLGGRFRFLQTKISPHVGAGIPVFFSDGARYGARIAAGGELRLGKVSVIAELGYEHFFNPEEMIEANVIVPIVGVQGRLR